MKKYYTNLRLIHKNTTLKTNKLDFKKEIFHRNSPSPFILYISLIHLFRELKIQNMDIKLLQKINYLFYMDDLKVLLSRVKVFRNDNRMQSDEEKCGKVTFRIGSPVKFKNINLDINTEITELEHNKAD